MIILREEDDRFILFPDFLCITPLAFKINSCSP